MAEDESGAQPPHPGARRPRFGLRHRLLAIGLLGALMAALIAQSALAGLGHVHRSNAAVGLITRAQSLQQDADMMHDALRGDVYDSALVGHRIRSKPPAQVQALLQAHVRQLTGDMSQIASLHLTGPAQKALADLPRALNAYAQLAATLVEAAGVTPTADVDLRRFDALFNALVAVQKEVTRQLGQAAAQTKRDAEHAATSAERQILLASTAALAVMLLLSWMLDRMGASLARQAARQRGVAETLQDSLLPDRLPYLPGMTLAARYLPGGAGVEVGGDWYDVIVLPTGEVGLVMGDVVGHDLRAASVMGQLRNALRAYALEGLSPGLALGRLNHFARQIDPDEMATCVFALFHPQASTLLIANAGHYPPLIVGPDRQATFVEYVAYPPVGGLEETTYVEKLYHLQPGSTVLLYTDGLIERRGEGIDVGMSRLLAAAAGGPADVDRLCEHVLAQLVPGGLPADDVALLALSAQPELGGELHLTVRAAPTELGPLRRTIGRWLEEALANPDEIFELTVAVCEAAGNAIEHAYGPDRATFTLTATLSGRRVEFSVTDLGHWRPPRGKDRGRGLDVIEEFTDSMEVATTASGTTVWLRRELAAVPADGLWHARGAG